MKLPCWYVHRNVLQNVQTTFREATPMNRIEGSRARDKFRNSSLYRSVCAGDATVVVGHPTQISCGKTNRLCLCAGAIAHILVFIDLTYCIVPIGCLTRTTIVCTRRLSLLRNWRTIFNGFYLPFIVNGPVYLSVWMEFSKRNFIYFSNSYKIEIFKIKK